MKKRKRWKQSQPVLFRLLRCRFQQSGAKWGYPWLLLEPASKNGLHEKLFAQVVALLTEQGLILKKGTIVDSTIISAPSSTKNKEKKRATDAHQVKKGNTWYFDYKAHIGVDKDGGLVHTVKATSANVHGVSQVPSLLTGQEVVVYGGSDYWGAGKREDAIVRNKAGR